MSMKISRHAAKRLRVRQGLSNSAQENLIEKVLTCGLHLGNTSGKLNDYLVWLRNCHGKGDIMRPYIYGEYVYLISISTKTIVTSFTIDKHHLKRALATQRKKRLPLNDA